MTHCGLKLLGSSIVLLAHVQSLVLLTANFEDIKKIAQRFVPESVAENLADFIAKATEGIMGDNISEENEQNFNKKASIKDSQYDDTQSVSNDDEERTPHKMKDTPKSNKAIKKSIEQIPFENYDYHKEKFSSNNKRKKQKRKPDKPAKDPKKISKRLKHQKKNDLKPIKGVKKAKAKATWENKDASEFSDDVVNSSKSYTAGYLEEGVISNDYEKSAQRVKGIFDYFNKYLGNESKEVKKIRKPKRNSGKMYKVDRSVTVTTRVERNEFDQYDNTYYPKAELLATSGSLSLTKVVDGRKSQHGEEWI